METALERSGSAAQPRIAEGLPGVNFFLLSATKYVAPLAAQQANELGGSVRKGEHSQIVVFWRVDHFSNTEAEPDSVTLAADGEESPAFCT